MDALTRKNFVCKRGLILFRLFNSFITTKEILIIPSLFCFKCKIASNGNKKHIVPKKERKDVVPKTKFCHVPFENIPRNCSVIIWQKKLNSALYKIQ